MNNIPRSNHKRRNAPHSLVCGFTLIEMIVAIAIFSIAIVIALGSILSISDLQRRAAAMQHIQDNVRFSLETMAKEMRTGIDFPSCSGCSSLTFTNAQGNTITYELNGTAIERTTTDGSFPITASNITVDRMQFYVSGEASDDGLQPKVTIVMRATAQVKGRTIEFNLQTTVSQRVLDS